MRKLVMPIVCVALVAAACSGPGDEEVATVGDKVVTVADVAELFEIETIPIDSGFRDAASWIVALTALIDAYEDEFGTVLDETAVDALHEEFMASLAADFVTVPEATGIPDSGEEMIRFNARLAVLREEVSERLAATPEFAAGLLAYPEGITTVCVRHILTETEDEILDVQARLEAGEDFAAVADEVSLDTATPGGDLGCAIADVFVVPFAVASMEAEVGTLHGPVTTEYGFHLIIVDERTAPTADEITTNPDPYLSAEVLDVIWAQWLNDNLQDADIEVNPEFGVWDAAMMRIVASPTE